MRNPSLFHRISAAFLAWTILLAGLTAAGSIVFEPQEDAMGFCKERNILVVDGELPKDAIPEDPADDTTCSSASSISWVAGSGSAFALTPNAPFVRIITSSPAPIERFGTVETPPPCV